MTAAARGYVMLVCTDCKRTMRGHVSDVHRRSCESCGGQLKVRRYGPRSPRK